MKRIVHAVESFGDTTVEWADRFNAGLVTAIERATRGSERAAGQGVENLVRILVALGRTLGGILRMSMFFLPAVLLAASGVVAENPAFLWIGGAYAAGIIAVGIAFGRSHEVA